MSRKKEQEIGRKKGNSQIRSRGMVVLLSLVLLFFGVVVVCSHIYINRIFLSLAVNFSIYLLSCFFTSNWARPSSPAGSASPSPPPSTHSGDGALTTRSTPAASTID